MSDAATQEKLAIFNDALDELEVSRIDSFEARSPTAAKASARFTRVSRDLLALYPWTFDLSRVSLSQLGTPFTSAYDYVYDVPADARLVAVYDREDSDQPYRDYRLLGGQVHCDRDALWADVRSLDPDTSVLRWPPLFRSAVVKAIAANACLKVGGTRTLRADLMAEAQGDASSYPRGGLIAAAAEEDGQQHSGGRLELAAGPLIEARRSTGHCY